MQWKVFQRDKPAGERAWEDSRHVQSTEATILTSSVSLFVLSFLFQAVFIFQGLDVTDTGFHLSNQVEAFSKSVDSARIYPMIFLTDFFGGMWLSIAQEPSLLWARIGGVVLYSLNAVIVCSILSSYFPRRRAFITTLVCSFFVTMRPGINIIDYYTFPAFLLNVQLWLFHKRLQVPSGTTDAGLFEFLLGFMVVPIVLSRMSLVLLVPCSVAMLLYHFLIRNHADRIARSVALSFLGCACSAVLFGALYGKLGLIDSGLLTLLIDETSSMAADQATHNVARLLSVYWNQAQVMLRLTAYCMFGLYVISIIGWKSGRTLANILIVGLPLISAAYFCVQVGDMDKIVYRVIMTAAGCVTVLALLTLRVDRERDDRVTWLMTAGFVVMVVSPLGSAPGLNKLFHGMWLVLPLTVLHAEKVHGRVRSLQLSAMLSHAGAILVLMALFSLVSHFTNIYRDDENRFHLTQPFGHPSLACIHSTPGRVQVVDELLATIERYTEKNDEILLASSLPLFHYLSERKATLHKSWIVLASLNNIKKKQQLLIEENRLPRLFIHAKVDTRRERNWPYITVDCYEPDIEKLKYLQDEYIRRLRYRLLWENSSFAVYGSPIDRKGARQTQDP